MNRRIFRGRKSRPLRDNGLHTIVINCAWRSVRVSERPFRRFCKQFVVAKHGIPSCGVDALPRKINLLCVDYRECSMRHERSVDDHSSIAFKCCYLHPILDVEVWRAVTCQTLYGINTTDDKIATRQCVESILSISDLHLLLARVRPCSPETRPLPAQT